MAQQPHAGIPILTDEIAPGGAVGAYAAEREALIVELQTALAARAFARAEDVVRHALGDLEAKLLREITERLRRELPELVDATLREYLGPGQED